MNLLLFKFGNSTFNAVDEVVQDNTIHSSPYETLCILKSKPMCYTNWVRPLLIVKAKISLIGDCHWGNLNDTTKICGWI